MACQKARNAIYTSGRSEELLRPENNDDGTMRNPTRSNITAENADMNEVFTPGKQLEFHALLGTGITIFSFVVQVIGIRGSHYLVVSCVISLCMIQ